MTNPTEKKKEGKIAICAFERRVCPRFDMTHEVLILEGRDPGREPAEKMNLSRFSPEDRVGMLVQAGIHLVIVGGMQERFQQMFHRQNIEVIWGVMGEIKDVIRAYGQGLLHSGVGAVPKPPGSRGPKE
jgi:hypothetical protein